MNFATYAESLPGTVLDQLYQSLYVCQAILHSLPPLAKQYVVRMLHVGAIPAGKQALFSRCTCILRHSSSTELCLQNGSISGRAPKGSQNTRLLWTSSNTFSY